MMKSVIVALLTQSVVAFTVAPAKSLTRPVTSTQLYETFDLGLGEDSMSIMPEQLKGEAEYKQWVNKIADDSLLNRKVSLLAKISIFLSCLQR
jgi:hypothetical protein